MRELGLTQEEGSEWRREEFVMLSRRENLKILKSARQREELGLWEGEARGSLELRSSRLAQTT